MINIKDLDPCKIKIDKMSYKNIPIYYIEYMMVKDLSKFFIPYTLKKATEKIFEAISYR